MAHNERDCGQGQVWLAESYFTYIERLGARSGGDMYDVNHVPAIDLSKSTTGCCTLIEPADWDDQTFRFANKLFAKTSTKSFLYVPLNMGSVMKKAQALIEQAGAGEKEWLILSREVSPWHADHYFAVTKDVPGLKTEPLTGLFLSKVFEGPYKNARIWHQQLVEHAKSKGKLPLHVYFFYTTCPKCSKSYGKNYVVGFVSVQ